MQTIYIVADYKRQKAIRVHNNEADAEKFCAGLNARLSETGRSERPYTIDYRIVWDHYEPLPSFAK